MIAMKFNFEQINCIWIHPESKKQPNALSLLGRQNQKNTDAQLTLKPFMMLLLLRMRHC